MRNCVWRASYVPKGASPGSAVWAEQAVQRDTDHRHHVTVTPWFRVRGEGVIEIWGEVGNTIVTGPETGRHCTK